MRRPVFVLCLLVTVLAFGGAGVVRLRRTPAPEELEILVVDESGAPMPDGALSIAELMPGRWTKPRGVGRLDAQGRITVPRPQRRFSVHVSWSDGRLGPVVGLPAEVGRTLRIEVSPEDLRPTLPPRISGILGTLASHSSRYRTLVSAPLPAPYEGELLLELPPGQDEFEVQVRSWGVGRPEVFLERSVVLEAGRTVRLPVPRIPVPWEVRVDGRAMRRVPGPGPVRLAPLLEDDLVFSMSWDASEHRPDLAAVHVAKLDVPHEDLERLREVAAGAGRSLRIDEAEPQRLERRLASAGATRASFELALQGPFEKSILARLKRKGCVDLSSLAVWFRGLLEECPPTFEDVLVPACKALDQLRCDFEPLRPRGDETLRLIQIPGDPWIAIARIVFPEDDLCLVWVAVDDRVLELVDLPLRTTLHELGLIPDPPCEPWADDIWTSKEFLDRLPIWGLKQVGRPCSADTWKIDGPR
jgi:hypothetical protein